MQTDFELFKNFYSFMCKPCRDSFLFLSFEALNVDKLPIKGRMYWMSLCCL